jgi:hypothetical protein
LRGRGGHTSWRGLPGHGKKELPNRLKPAGQVQG